MNGLLALDLYTAGVLLIHLQTEIIHCSCFVDTVNSDPLTHELCFNFCSARNCQ